MRRSSRFIIASTLLLLVTVAPALAETCKPVLGHFEALLVPPGPLSTRPHSLLYRWARVGRDSGKLPIHHDRRLSLGDNWRRNYNSFFHWQEHDFPEERRPVTWHRYRKYRSSSGSGGIRIADYF